MKRRGLGAKRGIDVLMSSIKKEKQFVEQVSDLGNADAHHDQSSDSTIKADVSFDLLESEVVVSDKKTKPKKHKAKKTDKAKKAQDGDGEQVTLVQIAVASLQSGKYQPRKEMNQDALQELATSIKQHGVMQPIVIRPLLHHEDKTDDAVTHEIIAGERRWRAAKMAGLSTVPAIERVLSDEVAIALALIENIQREDLNVLEQAAALQRFHTEFGMSHAMIADVVGKARATVTNLLRLNNLHDTVKSYMQQGLLDMGHARTLLSLSAGQQPIIAKKIIDANMTVRDAEKLVKSILNPQITSTQTDTDHELKRLSQKISDSLGAVVKLKQNKDGKGSIELMYHSHDEFVQLLSTLGVVLD